LSFDYFQLGTKLTKLDSCLTKPSKDNNMFLYVNTFFYFWKRIMRFRDLQTKIKDLPAFNLNDIRKIDPGFHRQQLTDWLKRDYIHPLVNGYYLMADTNINESYLFMLANRIYHPSYISLESALAIYHIIPETALTVTSVSSRKTKLFESQFGRFSYRSIKPQLMFGYQIIGQGKPIKYTIANLEKTILDYLYLNPKIDSLDDLIELRWNKEELSALNESSVFKKYLNIFNNKALEHRVYLLMEYIHA
jgi:predicted transcriptional regulator of viral defense system